MLEYRLSVDDDELDDLEEGTTLNVDDDMGDYGVDEEEEELTIAVIEPVGPMIGGPGAASEAPPPRTREKSFRAEESSCGEGSREKGGRQEGCS